jgi:hypothetical protein
MRIILSIVFFLLFSPLIPGFALAQEVTANLKPGYGTVNDVFTLSVMVSGKSSSNAAPPLFESSPDFTLEPIGTTTTTQIVNGVQSFQFGYSYRVIPSPKLKPGTYLLPKGSINVNGQQHRLENIKITILFLNEKDNDATVSGRTGPIDFAQIVSDLRPYVGEQIIYRAELASTLPVAKAKLADIQLDNFLRESFGKDQERRRRVGTTTIFSLAEPLFPTTPGKVVIPKREVSADLRAPRQIPGIGNLPMLDDFFADLDPLVGGASITRRAFAKPIEMEVRPLPPAPKDSKQNYYPVGSLKLTSDLNKSSVKQGEAVTLTIDVVSDGNLKPFDLNLSGLDGSNFSAFVEPPKLEQINSNGEKLISRKTFSVSLVTKRAGSITIPSIRFYYFDPKRESYELASTEEYKLIVLPTPDAPRSDDKFVDETKSEDATNTPEDIKVEEKPTDGPMIRDKGVSPVIFWSLLGAGPFALLCKLLLLLAAKGSVRSPSAKQEIAEIASKLKKLSFGTQPETEKALSETKRALNLIRSAKSELGLSSADVQLIQDKIERIIYAPTKQPGDIKVIATELERLHR